MEKAFTLEMIECLAVVTFDLPGQKVNILTPAVMKEFEALLGELEKEGELLDGAVIISGKPDTFIAGADISFIEDITDQDAGRSFSRQIQSILARLEALPFPVAAAIHGACLGGGLEVALACSSRLVTDSTRTFLGLPETTLGIIPGAGGTQRLPRLVGITEALAAITTGKRIYSRKALAMGLADEMVVKEHLLEAALGMVRRKTGKKPTSRYLKRPGLLLETTRFGRNLIFDKARKEVGRAAGENYPAPMAALKAVEEGCLHGMEKGLESESRLFGELAVTETCKNLIGIFHLREKFARGDRAPASDISRVGVIGGGVMGSGIATLAAEKGLQVRLIERSREALGKALKGFQDTIRKKRKKGIFSPVEAFWTASRLSWDTEVRGLKGSDLIIEAVTESPEIKEAVMAGVADSVSEEALILSNTSSLSISMLAAPVPEPSRVAGLHFFNPVDRMPLVEVIRGEATSDETVERVSAFARRLGKIPVVVRDHPGFLVNRLLLPYLNEAARLVEEGAGVRRVDDALQKFGMPMGAFILLDVVGLDVASHAGGNLYEEFGERMRPSGVLPAMMVAGRLGRKSGRGFYLYDSKGTRRSDPHLMKIISPLVKETRTMANRDIVDRLILPMINEASLCLEEKVVENPEAVDAGMVLGAGFPPYTGGPLRYADRLGALRVVEGLEGLPAEDGRFTPSRLLKKLARTGKGFYG
jgi:3-hydroxyacyl-CoA dehydrogenase/enoyl-CoA hydratase/3-hydroxybutyryl-CoA epimerase